MLETRKLACQRGERLLFKGLDLRLGAGELLRIGGANGMGKTSLLRLLAGLSLPAAGSVSWQGAEIQSSREAFHAALLYLGHAPALNDLLTPPENLAFACATASLLVSAVACQEALTRLGLTRQLELPCKLLSQGQRRRVGLARLALSASRPLWILDEPFTALDVAAVSALAAQIDAHCAAGGSVIFTSHQDVPFATPLRVLDVEAFAP
ncbi:cytochrome c biogenesis heme-transporting ATPase CcmA [Uliginosibacterium aquaticum]|uniref:Cytochrome c biogenesis heme-transporting ATPase CcmA n=1 Tax=Uliginosibacterium aquaticum TaxID=2731212 RepID=A0ABX2IF40_9RHOO|nr:cytochrome c biogenesis heme-transporting ATPase CcmA [Uliginosibacterium aquaticum]NSL53562.1 cytochrome c biogenesis heme-transporting ATPase CcmA [Uliginosibacterium aquaticum]